jgi:hypothetical protein
MPLSQLTAQALLSEAKRLDHFRPKANCPQTVNRHHHPIGDESSADMIINSFEKMPLGQAKFSLLQFPSAIFLERTKNTIS